jgi:hypothetical protein
MRHKAALVASLPKPQRDQFPKMNPTQQQQMLFWTILQRWQTPDRGKLPPLLTEDDINGLRNNLSPKIRKRLEGQPSTEQAHLILGWLRPGPWHFDEGQRPRAPMPRDDDERIANFFEKGLSREQRDRLLSMPGEELLLQLQSMYDQSHMRPPEGGGRRSNAPPARDMRPEDAGPPGPWSPGEPPPPPPGK